MRYTAYAALAILTLITCACQKNKKDDDVISQTYVHKYGYTVSAEEWKSQECPGQVISSLRNGVTVTSTYENGHLNGPCTYTYPNSRTIEKYILYKQDIPVKEISYDIAGMPTREVLQLTQSHNSLTTWYTDGVPKSLEEFSGDRLVKAQYFTPNHELEASIEEGNGLRITRDVSGALLCKDEIQDGHLLQRESFYKNGTPESIATYYKGKLHGSRHTFSEKGEPLAVEHWSDGHLHGLCTYYANGTKTIEVHYLYGKKHGTETHFLDGNSISHQIAWKAGLKHGPELFVLADGSKKTVWNYDDKEVSRFRFEELSSLDSVVSESNRPE